MFTFLLINTALASNVPASTAAESAPTTDYDVQAAYLFNFSLSSIEWPTILSTADGIKIVTVCIIGDSPGFVKSLQKIQQSEMAAKKLKINIMQPDEGANLSPCNIAYIAKNKPNFKNDIAGAAAYPILTISPIAGFAASGGIIELVIKEVSDNAGGAPINSRVKISLIINNKAATNSHIKISPDLLEMAEVIR